MPKPKLDESVSLFPFLDIMASLIGILVLLITAATLAQIGQNVEDAADAQAAAKAKARIVQYRAVRKRLTSDSQEQQRLQKDIGEVMSQLKRSESKLSNPQFIEKAPAEVVAREQERQRELQDRHQRLLGRLQALTGDESAPAEQ